MSLKISMHVRVFLAMWKRHWYRESEIVNSNYGRFIRWLK